MLYMVWKEKEQSTNLVEDYGTCRRFFMRVLALVGVCVDLCVCACVRVHVCI